jgi:hypothetical protein
MAKYHLNWTIEFLSKDDDGMLLELANLDDGRYMLIMTDTKVLAATNIHRQVGFGPFDGKTFETKILAELKRNLLERRTQMINK